MSQPNQKAVRVETNHTDMIVSCPLPLQKRPPRAHKPHLEPKQHDAQLDYYGRRLATASSDRTIRLFEVEGESEYRPVDTLTG